MECDEARPECDRCKTRGLKCSYQEWVPKYQARVNENESSAGSSETLAERSNTTAEIEEGVVSETDLAHHYISHTSKTLAATSSQEVQSHSWCVVVPALAVTSTAVRSGMLALAACHMYVQAPRDANEEKAVLLRAAYSLYNKCLRQSGQQLQKLDQIEYVDAIVSTARILFALGLAFCQIERRFGKSLADSECWVWLPLLRGNFAVANAVEGSGFSDEALLHREDMTPEIVPETPHEIRAMTPEDERLEPPRTLAFLRRARVASLHSLRSTLAESMTAISDDRWMQYSKAVDLLDEVMAYTCTSPRVRSYIRLIFIWPLQVPLDFSEALPQGDKFALILYAHWLMLTVLLQDVWIVGDMGRAGIFEIVARSGEWSEDEQDLLLWPRRLLSVNL